MDTEERETWINVVNDEFSGKIRSDPPTEFFEIVREKYEEIMNAGWDDEPSAGQEPGSLNRIRSVMSDTEFLQLGAKLDYTK